MSGQRSCVILLAALAGLSMQGCDEAAAKSFAETLCVNAVHFSVDQAAYEALKMLDGTCGQFEANQQYCCEEQGAKLVEDQKVPLKAKYDAECTFNVSAAPHTAEGVGGAGEDYVEDNEDNIGTVALATFTQVIALANEGCGTPAVAPTTVTGTTTTGTTTTTTPAPVTVVPTPVLTPVPTTEVRTGLRSPAQAGNTTLDVIGVLGFQVGDTIVIDEGTDLEETNSIAGFGSIVLATPLLKSHPLGTTIRKTAQAAIVATAILTDGTTGAATEPTTVAPAASVAIAIVTDSTTGAAIEPTTVAPAASVATAIVTDGTTGAIEPTTVAPAASDATTIVTDGTTGAAIEPTTVAPATRLWQSAGRPKGLLSSGRFTWASMGMAAIGAAACLVGTALVARRTSLSRSGDDDDSTANLAADMEEQGLE